jgi:hypothetical protein
MEEGRTRNWISFVALFLVFLEPRRVISWHFLHSPASITPLPETCHIAFPALNPYGEAFRNNWFPLPRRN